MKENDNLILKAELTDDIIQLNRDVEHLIIQGAATRTKALDFDDKYKVLQFVHFADIHRKLDNWNRIISYINHYSDYISFALHTGDYCEANQSQYIDLYGEGNDCVRTIYNCVGNHDVLTGERRLAEKHATHELLFSHQKDWDVVFFDCDDSMTYYKDFPEANVRLIVLDLYYHIKEQREWLREILEEALDKCLCVITAMHETTGYINNTFGVTFHSMNDYNKYHINRISDYKEPDFDYYMRPLFEQVIVDFISKGGTYICNFAGHDHHDGFGMSKNGLLNSVVPSATYYDNWCDGKRVLGTKTQDCFNVVSIDTNMGLLKIVRVGSNIDHYLRRSTALCYDYKNKKIISNI